MAGDLLPGKAKALQKSKARLRPAD